MLQHADDDTGMDAGFVGKAADGGFGSWAADRELIETRAADEDLLRPPIRLLLELVARLTLLFLVDETPAAVQEEMQRLVKERPPEVISRLHPQYHLDQGAATIEPARVALVRR